mmetsp:Transcript_99581/g.257326  ORF Transcript_99581/g.257326 Transcript_99581/m.257326 type:complete len:203 (+) Transcript_99581:221-829(+)
MIEVAELAVDAVAAAILQEEAAAAALARCVQRGAHGRKPIGRLLRGVRQCGAALLAIIHLVVVLHLAHVISAAVAGRGLTLLLRLHLLVDRGLCRGGRSHVLLDLRRLELVRRGRLREARGRRVRRHDILQDLRLHLAALLVLLRARLQLRRARWHFPSRAPAEEAGQHAEGSLLCVLRRCEDCAHRNTDFSSCSTEQTRLA